MNKISRVQKDRNWIKFRVAGAVSIGNDIPINSLTPTEKLNISKALYLLRQVTESFDYN